MFNSDQAKGLANFYFDLAKGFVFSGIGTFVVFDWKISILASIMNLYLANYCIKLALNLLSKNE